MNLEWITQAGLLSQRSDTGVLLGYPLAVRKVVIEQVVLFYNKDYNAACATITDFAHLKWTLECTGGAFSLPLPNCEDVIGKTITLYKIWALQPERRPAVVQQNLAYTLNEISRHMSLLFKGHVVHTQQDRDVHIQLCVKVLEIFTQLDHHRTPPPTPIAVGTIVEAVGLQNPDFTNLNYKKGRVLNFLNSEDRVMVKFPNIGTRGLRISNVRHSLIEMTANNWDTLIRVLLGIIDYTGPPQRSGNNSSSNFSEDYSHQSPTKRETRGMPELMYVSMSVLLGVLLRSRLLKDDIWVTVSEFVPRWSHSLPMIRQWSAVVKALTISIQPFLLTTRTGTVPTTNCVPESKDSVTNITIAWEAIPKGFRKFTELQDTPVTHALTVWIRIIPMIGSVTSFTNCKVFHQAMLGIRTLTILLCRGWGCIGADRIFASMVAGSHPKHKSATYTHGLLIPGPSPSAESVMDLVGKCLMESIFCGPSSSVNKEEAAAARSVALSALCDVYLRPHIKPPVGIDIFYQAVKRVATHILNDPGEDQEQRFSSRSNDFNGAEAFVHSCRFMFSFDNAGVSSLIPIVVRVVDLVLRYPESNNFSLDKKYKQNSKTSIPLHVEDYDTDDELNQTTPTTTTTTTTTATLTNKSTFVPALLMLGSVLCWNPIPVASHSAIRSILLRSLLYERTPSVLVVTIQLCGLWTSYYLNKIYNEGQTPIISLRNKKDKSSGNSDPLCITAQSVVETVEFFLSEILGFLDEVQLPGKSEAKNVSSLLPLYISAIRYIEHSIVQVYFDICSDDTPKKEVVTALCRFVLNLNGHSGKEFEEEDVSRVCDSAITTITLCLLKDREIKTDSQVMKLLLSLIEMCCSVHSVSTLTSSSALRMFWTTMVAPDNQNSNYNNAHHVDSLSDSTRIKKRQPSHITEACFPEETSKSRYFALDGTKLCTFISHSYTDDSLDKSNSGSGVTIIVRDPFGRHVWDAVQRFDKLPTESDGVPGSNSSSVFKQRRHGISVGPGRQNDTSGEKCPPSLELLLGKELGVTVGELTANDVDDKINNTSSDSQQIPSPVKATETFTAAKRSVSSAAQHVPEQARLLLSHLQLLGRDSTRIVELEDSNELKSAIKMLDATPHRSVHRFLAVFLHDEDGTEVLHDEGVEWYLNKSSPPSDEIACKLRTLPDFRSFISELGNPIDPGSTVEEYTGGGGGPAGDRWRRQRLHYYADQLNEAVWCALSATPAGFSSTTADEQVKWEDRTPVRIIWNDTRREFNPSALDSEALSELKTQIPPWIPQRSKTLDFIVQPLPNDLASVRIVLPVDNERWAGRTKRPETDFFDPVVWHPPLLDGMVCIDSLCVCTLFFLLRILSARFYTKKEQRCRKPFYISFLLVHSAKRFYRFFSIKKKKKNR